MGGFRFQFLPQRAAEAQVLGHRPGAIGGMVRRIRGEQFHQDPRGGLASWVGGKEAAQVGGGFEKLPVRLPLTSASFDRFEEPMPGLFAPGLHRPVGVSDGIEVRHKRSPVQIDCPVDAVRRFGGKRLVECIHIAERIARKVQTERELSRRLKPLCLGSQSVAQVGQRSAQRCQRAFVGRIAP